MIIGLCGDPGVGKDTVAEMLVQRHGYTRYSFAGVLKDVTALIFGWPRHLLEGDTVESRFFRERTDLWWSTRLGIRDFTPRCALRDWGSCGRNWHPEIWIAALERRLTAMPPKTVISDCRFPNEVALVQSLGGSMARVARGSVAPSQHPSDRGLDGIKMHVLPNHGSLGALEGAVDAFVGSLCAL